MKIDRNETREVIVTDERDPMAVACRMKKEGDIVQSVRGWHQVTYEENEKTGIAFGPSARIVRADGQRVIVVSVRD